MEISSRPIGASPGLRPQKPMQAPQFRGGVGDMASAVIGAIDSNRLIELIASDGLGMILPRTAMALKMRGPDDGRETFLREMSGLVGNIFVVGWASHFALKLMGRSVNFYNPKGIPAEAWLNASTLESFGKIYDAALEKAKAQHPGNPEKGLEEARRHFLQNALEGLESGDRAFSLTGRLTALTPKPNETPAIIADRWKAMESLLQGSTDPNTYKQLSRLYQATDSPETKLKAVLNELTAPNGLEKLPYWGKFSPAQVEQFSQAFTKANSAISESGTTLRTIDFDRQAHQKTKEALRQWHQFSEAAGKLPPALAGNENGLHYPKTAHEIQSWKKALKTAGFDYDQVFTKARLSLSLDKLREANEDFTSLIEKEALHAGLTDTVNLKDSHGKLLTGDKNRKAVFTEIKHYLEQYVDRAAEAAKDELAGSGGEGWQDAVRRQLFGRENGAFWSNLFPRLEDGFATATLKAKRLYTWVPMGVAVLAMGVFTFYNNYITMKKHGGRIFFPGEGVPPPEDTKTPAIKASPAENSASFSAPKAAPPATTEPSATPTESPTPTNGLRHNGAFSQFQQARQSGGGLIA